MKGGSDRPTFWPPARFVMTEKFGQDRKEFAVKNDSHVTEFINDKDGHAEVDKGVSAPLVLDQAPSLGLISQGKGGNWSRIPPGAGVTAN